VRMVGEITGDQGSEWAAMTRVAELLGVGTPETVRKWVRQAQVDAGARPGTTSEESAEVRRLKRENAELKRANAILKAAAGWVMTDSEQVLARAAGWQSAIEARDAKGVGDFLHEDYALVLVVPAAVTMPRQEWVRVLDDYVVHAYDIHAQTVDVTDDTAVVLTLASQEATVLGQDRSGRFVLSDTWLRDGNGRWKVWRRHSTPTSAGAMPRG